MPVESGGGVRQQRGRDFEGVLNAMFEDASMEPRTRYRPLGEEIDGSFMYRGRPMLFEAKWTSDPVPASVLYSFQGKLGGKLMGTLGVFISMAGYSTDAINALLVGKALDLLLFDGADMRLISMPGGIGIEAAIDLKVRAAAEEGTVFLALSGRDVPLPPQTGTSPPELIVVVEGRYDVAILDALLAACGTHVQVMIVPAGGYRNLPLVALAQHGLRPGAHKLLVVADGDGRPEEVRRGIELAVQEVAAPADLDLGIVVVDPDLEVALGLKKRGENRRPPAHALPAAIRQIDLRRAASSDSEVAALFGLLGLDLRNISDQRTGEDS
jgi:hypothetical protein